MVLLLRVNNPNLGPLRFRFTASNYKGEPDWEESAQVSTHIAKVLVNSSTDAHFDIEVENGLLSDMEPTSEIELLSSEDSVSASTLCGWRFEILHCHPNCQLDVNAR